MADDENSALSSDPGNTTAALVISPLPTSDLDPGSMQDNEDGITHTSSIMQSHGGYLVTPSLNNPTLHGILTTPLGLQNAQLVAQPDGIQIITVSSPSELLSVPADGSVINPEYAIIAVNDGEYKPITLTNALAELEGEGVTGGIHIQGGPLEALQVTTTTPTTEALPTDSQPPPPGCPAWATRMKNCEKIGDYYRGYVDTEVELDLLLTYHKQQTMSFWGTRQSPSNSKPSTRLMWKSQYVPWDGIPFVNSGSRAVVMECQHGPRRKGSLNKKQLDELARGEYKQTCPARIYVKKVRKFPEYSVDPNQEKRSMKYTMDKAFHELKSAPLESMGQERYYVQLPLEDAHEFHDETGQKAVTAMLVAAESLGIHNEATMALEPEQHRLPLEPEGQGNRLHPQVVQKIRELVAGGEVRVYAVRKQLRAYVNRELLNGGSSESAIQRHDLTLFPTVNDLKNQIHQAVKDIENGTLPLTASTVNVELVGTGSADQMMQIDPAIWDQSLMSTDGAGPVPETVTVTLTQNPGEDGSHVISRIETHLSDGTTQVSTSLTPETARLLARINPSMFPPGSLVQLQAGSLVMPEEPSGEATLMEVNTESKLEPAVTPEGSIDLQVQDAIASTDSGGVLPILETSAADTPHILTQENHIISDQSQELISITMVPTAPHDLAELNAGSCEEDL